jgi:N-acetylmuramoyl-L-alanine amidase
MPFHWTGTPAARHYGRVSFLLALLVCWFSGTPGWASTIDKVEVHRDRIVLTFDQSVATAASFMLAGPSRIAVDVDGATPGGETDTGGPVAAIRQGWHGGGARVVFDLDRPAIVTDGHFGRDGRQLTLEFARADSTDFARAATGRLTRYQSGATPARDLVTMAIPAAAKGPPLPRVYGDDTRPLVVIDRGHGGHVPGAIAPDTGLEEMDFTL